MVSTFLMGVACKLLDSKLTVPDLIKLELFLKLDQYDDRWPIKIFVPNCNESSSLIEMLFSLYIQRYAGDLELTNKKQYNYILWYRYNCKWFDWLGMEVLYEEEKTIILEGFHLRHSLHRLTDSLSMDIISRGWGLRWTSTSHRCFRSSFITSSSMVKSKLTTSSTLMDHLLFTISEF